MTGKETNATLVRPGQYLLAVDRDDLKVLAKTLKDWQGPLRGAAPRHEVEAEDVRAQVKRAAGLLRLVAEILER